MCCLLDLDSKEKINLTGKALRNVWLLSHQYDTDTQTCYCFLLASLYLIRVFDKEFGEK